MQVLDLGRVVGMSAYELAVSKGYEGTLESWLESLRYDHSDEYKQFTDTIEAAKQEILSGKEEIKLSMTQIRDLVTKSLSDIGNAQKEATEAVKAEETETLSNISTAKSGALSNIGDAETNALTSLANTLNSAIRSINEKGTRWEKQIEDTGTLTKSEYNQNAIAKQKSFDDNAKEKQSAFDTHVSETQTALDNHIKEKQDAFDENATEKQTTFDENADQKTQEFDAHTEQIQNDLGQLKEDLVNLSIKTSSNETKAYNVTDLFTLNGFLNKKGEFVDNAATLCTNYIDVKKGEVYYLYISQDDENTLPIAVYDTNKQFVKGVENKGKTYQLQYFEYTVEEDCLIRISSMDANSSLIYKREFRNNSEVFDEINAKIGSLETYYEDETQYVLEHKTDDKYLDINDVETQYSGGLVSDYIEIDEGDSIKARSYVLYGNPVLVMYYSNKKIYKALSTSTDGINTVSTIIPPMVKYIRISSLDSSKEISFQILRHKSLIDSIKESSKEKKYVIPNTYDELALTNVTSGYINDNGTITSIDSYVTSDYIDLSKYDYFRLVSDYAWAICGYVTFDDEKQVVSYVKDSANTLKRIDIVPQNDFPTAKYIRFCGSVDKLHVYVKKQTNLITDGLEETLKTGNVLYHKKIAFCGDSFTEATNLGKTLYDNFIGCYKSFGWRIANRNKMNLYHDGVSGSTMHIVDKENPNDSQPFAYERYKNVPVDCDYIILQFGLNESNIANSDDTKGTKDSTDTTTMWGSWNTVLGYLIENHPTARIGIIMSDAWMPQSYFVTLKDICEWWGIPLLDLGGNPNVPVMNSGRRVGSGLILNPKVAELRNATFYNADGDAHPNDKGHEWRSTVIENWIRSL